MAFHALATVLTVEDDPIVRTDLRLVLEDAGFDVCANARDGVEAIELAREHQPDVILLDLGLPLLGGVAATRWILAERNVPIVALTGRSREHAAAAIEAGVSSCVLKPFVQEEVVGALLAAIATHASSTTPASNVDAGPEDSNFDAGPEDRPLRTESAHTLRQRAIAFGSQGPEGAELERQARQASRAWRRVQ
jgi:CheY-like chemotaxis protein